MKIITPTVPHNAWLDIFTIAGVDPKYSYVIENVSEVAIRLAMNNETYAERHNCILLKPNEEFFIQPAWGVASVTAQAVGSGKIAIRRAENTDIRAAMRKIVGLSDPRVLTQSLTQIEAASIEGRLFQATIDITVPISATSWFEFKAPTDKECAFTEFSFMPFYTGFEARVVTGSTGGTVGTIHPNRNANLRYDTPSSAVINSLTGTPTAGTLFSLPCLVPASGNNTNNRSTGTTSLVSGYRIVPASGSLRFQMINTSGLDNRVVVTLTWLEAPPSVFS